ncbi:GSCFA domain-containing protein [Flavobacterium sp.]|uniref:GSCFA domain-containing protein n=1 Tax=Flavobacterium sp. TaxID=239 RepID=UPI00374D6FC9
MSKSNNLIDYNSRIMSLGSCFAENMAKKLEYFKFDNLVNPFGIIFNPVSLEKLILRSIHKNYFTENDIFYHNEAWHCYEVHSELLNPNKEEFLKTLNELIDSTNNQITKSTHIIITLGTAWIYRNIETNEIVANCHKVPQKQFAKELLSVEKIQESLQNIITLIREVNKEVKFIFTVSPVRHIKDGFAENTLSKSHLITAIHQIVNCQLSIVNYFPSYEIMMDELRDYRFYAQDMLHPNQTAIDYIWIRFFENYVDEKEFIIMQQVCDIQKALHHKPFNPESERHVKFLENLNQKINILASGYPFMKF